MFFLRNISCAVFDKVKRRVFYVDYEFSFIVTIKVLLSVGKSVGK